MSRLNVGWHVHSQHWNLDLIICWHSVHIFIEYAHNSSYTDHRLFAMGLWIDISWNIYVCVLNCVQLFATPWNVACQSSLSMGFSRQNTGAGCHFPLLGSLLTQGLNPCLLHLLLVVNNPPANAGDTRGVDLIPGLGRFPWRRACNLLQYSCLGESHGQRT